MLPAPVQTVIDETGHTLEDFASHLMLDTQYSHAQIRVQTQNLVTSNMKLIELQI